MGTWGNKLYENDTALDVRAAIESIAEKQSQTASIVSETVALLERDYSDEDDMGVAWLAAADRLMRRGSLPIAEMYRKLRCGKETGESIRSYVKQKMCGDCLKKKVSRRVASETDMQKGGVYVYTVSPENAADPAFAGWTVGFICVEVCELDRHKCPMLYIFRTKRKLEELCADPKLALDGKFWRMGRWDDFRYVYRQVIYSNRRNKEPWERLVKAGQIDELPKIDDEFVPWQNQPVSGCFWVSLEERILYVRVLNE